MKKLLMLVCGVTLIISCSSENEISVDEERIKSTVILYNSLLAKGYRIQNMNVLAEAATEQRATKAYYHMAALGEGSVKMDAKLNHITFSDLRILSPAHAEVVTEEKWDYTYVNFKTEKQVNDNSVDYVNKYKLVKKSNKWYVDEIDVMRTEEKKNEKYAPLTGSPVIRGPEKE